MIFLIYRARYLALLVCGENHPHVALLDSNIGLILHAVAEYELSLKFLEKALELSKKYFGARSLKTAVGHHLVARTQSCIGIFTIIFFFFFSLFINKSLIDLHRRLPLSAYERTRDIFNIQGTTGGEA
jgi:tetratricopeptide (TPR) repeat protein